MAQSSATDTELQPSYTPPLSGTLPPLPDVLRRQVADPSLSAETRISSEVAAARAELAAARRQAEEELASARAALAAKRAQYERTLQQMRNQLAAARTTTENPTVGTGGASMAQYFQQGGVVAATDPYGNPWQVTLPTPYGAATLYLRGWLGAPGGWAIYRDPRTGEDYWFDGSTWHRYTDEAQAAAGDGGGQEEGQGKKEAQRQALAERQLLKETLKSSRTAAAAAAAARRPSAEQRMAEAGPAPAGRTAWEEEAARRRAAEEEAARLERRRQEQIADAAEAAREAAATHRPTWERPYRFQAGGVVPVPPGLAPPDATAVVGEAPDRPGDEGGELVIFPRAFSLGLVRYTDEPELVNVPAGTVVVPVPPHMEKELQTIAQPMPPERSTPLPEQPPPPPQLQEGGIVPALPPPLWPWGLPDPWAGLAPAPHGNLTQLMALNEAQRRRLDQQLRSRGQLGGVEGLARGYQQLGPGRTGAERFYWS